MNGKGKGPIKGYNYSKFRRGFDEIDWKNTRRNKVQKMFGKKVDPQKVTCWNCNGRGENLGLDEKYSECPTCKGKKYMTMEVWKETLFAQELDLT